MTGKSCKRILSRFKSESGDVIEGLLDLPADVTVQNLQRMCNALLKQDEESSFLFFVNDKEITDTLEKAIDDEKHSEEKVVEIVYQQQAIFRVKPVSRCTSSLPGHAESVISISFSPNSKSLASGSGDTTVRIWDLNTQTPHYTLTGHTNWVLCLTWSADGKKLASGDKNGTILIWDHKNGKQLGKPMLGHKGWITSLSWEPYFRNAECRHLASASKDCDIRIWDVVLGQTIKVLSSHNRSVTCVKWGGANLIYSASQDKTIKVWRSSDGVLCRTLEGHAHWVNTLALSTEWVLKTGAFDPVEKENVKNLKKDTLQQMAQTRYNKVNVDGERLVSGSDDFTLFLWAPETEKKPIARLVGHQQLVNDVKFSPDGRILASASFDKSIKLWESRTGKYIGVLRGHVQAVYVISWSADSRYLVSGSADSTLKVWNIKDKRLEIELPGHADEVYAVDWAPDGSRVASGGKDKLVRLWQH